MINRVLNFINLFYSPETVDKFTCGLCYWFAHILYYRFSGEFSDVAIMYDGIVNHFVTRIGGRVYDITGDVTDKYPDVVPWEEAVLKEDYNIRAIIRDCILKENGM